MCMFRRVQLSDPMAVTLQAPLSMVLKLSSLAGRRVEVAATSHSIDPFLRAWFAGLQMSGERASHILCFRNKSQGLWYFLTNSPLTGGFPWWLSQKRIYLQCRRPGFNPQVGTIPWRGEGLPTPVFWPGKFHGQYSPWGCKELDALSLSPLNGRQGAWLQGFIRDSESLKKVLDWTLYQRKIHRWTPSLHTISASPSSPLMDLCRQAHAFRQHCQAATLRLQTEL